MEATPTSSNIFEWPEVLAALVGRDSTGHPVQMGCVRAFPNSVRVQSSHLYHYRISITNKYHPDTISVLSMGQLQLCRETERRVGKYLYGSA